MHFCQTQGVGLQKTLSVCLSPFFLPSNSDFNQRWLERIGEVVWGTEEFSMHFFHNCFHMGVNEATGLLSSPFWGVWSLDVEICQIWGVFSSFLCWSNAHNIKEYVNTKKFVIVTIFWEKWCIT